MVAWGFVFALIKPIVEATGPAMALLLTRVVAGPSLLLWVKATKTSFSFPSCALFIIIAIAGLLDAFGFASYNTGVATD